jgi:C4-dicarboxylate transporter DctM subunit
MIILGIITGQSIGKLFLAGIFPGLLISFSFLSIIYVWCKIKPTIAPISRERFTLREKMHELPEFAYVAVIFFLVIGGLMAGIFTPTESGAIGMLAVLLLGLIKRGLSSKSFLKAVEESLQGSIMIFFLIACSTVMGHFLAITEIPQIMGNWLTSLPLPRTMIMIIICFFYLLGGSFIDDMAFMILATPILYPAIPKLGYDPIWFCVMVGVAVMVGGIIPPVAMNVFVVKSITGESFGDIYKGVVPFLFSFIAVGFVLFCFPEIATWLPYKLMGK